MAATLATSSGLRFYREVCTKSFARSVLCRKVVHLEQQTRVQVCRCIPTLMEQFDLTEVTTKHTLRRVLAERFEKHREQGNPDVRFPHHWSSLEWPALVLCSSALVGGGQPVICMCQGIHVGLYVQTVNMLIYKGRQELEVCAPDLQTS